MDREIALIIFSSILVAYVAWIDVRAFLHKRKRQSDDEESYHAKQAQLYQRFIDICDRQAKARAESARFRARAEREYLKATGKPFAPLGGRT